MTSDEKEKLGADLSAYLDGELDSRRMSEIELLLEESEEARALLERLGGVARRLGELPRVKAPSDLAALLARYAAPGDATPIRNVFRQRSVWMLSRVAASAAVIVVCFYTGWVMHERMGEAPVITGTVALREPLAPTAPEVKKHAERGVDSYADAIDGEQSARRGGKGLAGELAKLEALGYVGGDESIELEAAPEPAPVFAARMPDESGAVDALAEAADGDACVGSAAAADDIAPTVEITVTPQDAEQYAAALAAVSERDDSSSRKRLAGGAGEIVQDYFFELPPEDVNNLLRTLEERAPRQVSVAMRFKSADMARVQQMVLPAMIQDSEGQAASRELLASEESPAAPAKAECAPEGSETEESQAYAFRARGGRGAAGRGRVARQAEAEKRGVAVDTRNVDLSGPDESAASELEKPSLESRLMDRQPAVEKVALSTSESLRLLSEEKAAAAASPAEDDREIPAPTETKAASPSAKAVVLRISIIPPPPATQPAPDGD